MRLEQPTFFEKEGCEKQDIKNNKPTFIFVLSKYKKAS